MLENIKCWLIFGPCMSAPELKKINPDHASIKLSSHILSFPVTAEGLGGLKQDFFFFVWLGEQHDWSASSGMTWPEQPLTAEYSFRGRWHRVGVLASDPKYILVLIRCCLAPRRNFPPGPQHANKPVNKAAHMRIFSVSRECWTRQMHRCDSAIICCSFHFLKLVFPQLPKLCFTGQIDIFYWNLSLCLFLFCFMWWSFLRTFVQHFGQHLHVL